MYVCWHMYVMLAYVRHVGICTSCWHMTSCGICYVMLAWVRSLSYLPPRILHSVTTAAESIAMEFHRFRFKVWLYPASCIWKICGLLGIHLLIFGKYIYSYRDDFIRRHVENSDLFTITVSYQMYSYGFILLQVCKYFSHTGRSTCTLVTKQLHASPN